MKYGKFKNYKIKEGGGGGGGELKYNRLLAVESGRYAYCAIRADPSSCEPHHLVFFRVRSIKVRPILKNFIIDKALRTRFSFDNLFNFSY